MTSDEITEDIDTIDKITSLLERCVRLVRGLNECPIDTPQYSLAVAIDDAMDLASDTRTELENEKIDNEDTESNDDEE